MDSIKISVAPIDDYIITASEADEVTFNITEEQVVKMQVVEYPAELDVLSAKISEVEEVANEASSAATTALAAATTAQSSADAAMSQAEAATDMAATNTLSISSILSNFTAWVLGTYLGALTLLDVAIAAGDSLQAMAGKLQGQLNAVKVRLSVLEGNIIFDTTLAAASSSLVITTDSLGVALSLNEVDIMIIHPAMPTNEMRLQVNDIATNYYTYAYYNRSSFSIICGYYGGVITGQLRYDAISHQLIGDFVVRAKYSTTQYTSYLSNGFIESPNMQNKISKLVFFFGAANIPAGTRIVLKRAIK